MQTLLAIVSAFTLSGNVFTASSIFVSISILNIMRVPMGLLPIFIAITVQVWLNCIQWLKNASWVCYIRLKNFIQIFWCDWRNSQLVTKRVIFFFPFLFFAWDNQWNSIFSFHSEHNLVNKVWTKSDDHSWSSFRTVEVKYIQQSLFKNLGLEFNWVTVVAAPSFPEKTQIRLWGGSIVCQSDIFQSRFEVLYKLLWSNPFPELFIGSPGQYKYIAENRILKFEKLGFLRDLEKKSKLLKK